ncbi:hypothetical protein PsorP6_016078 [Peronosclerospora sorghi]|uniref:Uncharacterized protein n=1 Tax=Peronosclerospora sorghi TaxID=230839 RepID=A0ACC0WMY4_9STRA|nr:hypothetical protein PsorP6_016078 [Peronosclerospora sorghi]
MQQTLADERKKRVQKLECIAQSCVRLAQWQTIHRRMTHESLARSDHADAATPLRCEMRCEREMTRSLRRLSSCCHTMWLSRPFSGFLRSLPPSRDLQSNTQLRSNVLRRTRGSQIALDYLDVIDTIHELDLKWTRDAQCNSARDALPLLDSAHRDFL